MSGRGLDRLQQALDEGRFPASWPHDVCRDAWCGDWERNNGAYYWHRTSDHDGNGHAIAPPEASENGSSTPTPGGEA